VELYACVFQCVCVCACDNVFFSWIPSKGATMSIRPHKRSYSSPRWITLERESIIRTKMKILIKLFLIGCAEVGVVAEVGGLGGLRALAFDKVCAHTVLRLR